MEKINTTKGLMDESELQKRVGSFENENEQTTWTEYWLDGDPTCRHVDSSDLACKSCGAEKVHRSVTMRLKKALEFGLEQQQLI